LTNDPIPPIVGMIIWQRLAGTGVVDADLGSQAEIVIPPQPVAAAPDMHTASQVG